MQKPQTTKFDAAQKVAPVTVVRKVKAGCCRSATLLLCLSKFAASDRSLFSVGTANQNITERVIVDVMNGADVQDARAKRGWTQTALANRLGVSQAYVCLLERGRRAVPPRLAQKLARLLDVPASMLPLESMRGRLRPDEVPAALGALGYTGFAYLRSRRRLNPAELALEVLRAADVDARVVEALPWMLLTYPDLDWPWLLREAKADDLQNRLGFLLGVARELAVLRGNEGTAQKLAEQERALERSRLLREDAFRESMTEAERHWLREHRSSHAAHWNVLSSMNASELADVY